MRQVFTDPFHDLCVCVCVYSFVCWYWKILISHCISNSNSSLNCSSESVPSGESQSVTGGDEDTLDDYQELNAREEQDIENMMEVCEYAISNAEAFAEKLSRELQVLDGVCTQTLWTGACYKGIIKAV